MGGNSGHISAPSRSSSTGLSILFALRRHDLSRLLPYVASAAILLAILAYVFLFITRAKHCVIYVVGDFSDNTGTAHFLVERFKKEKFPRVAGLQIVPVAQDDKSDKDNAVSIAKRIVHNDDALMVIGHFASTRTKVALPFYLEQSNPPIPVIMPTETNPELLPSDLDPNRYYPMLRLSPNDCEQARDAVAFAHQHGASSFWVIEDKENEVYSTYLTREFVRKAASSGTDFPGAPLTVALRSQNLFPPSPDLLHTLHVDGIFFAGGWENALMLLKQVPLLFPSSTPLIVLTDSAADEPKESLTKAVEDTKVDPNQIHGVVVSYPFRHSFVVNSKNNDESYFGELTRDLVAQLVFRANQKSGADEALNPVFYRARTILGIPSAADARASLIKSMKDDTFPISKDATVKNSAVKSGAADHRTEGHVFTLQGTGYKFARDGRRIDTQGNFRFWKIRDHQYEDLPENAMPRLDDKHNSCAPAGG